MRISTGTDGLDALLDGGLPQHRLYVVSGPPGSGKTTFSAQFLTEGVQNGEKCLYLTMHETEAELVNDMSSFSFGFERAVGSKHFRFMNVLSTDVQQVLSQYGSEPGLTGRVAALIEAWNIDRAVIDSTMLLQHFLEDPEDQLTEFITALKETDATILLISEMTDPSSYSEEHYLAHGVVFFHNFLEETGMTRAVQIIKMRGTPIDCDMRSVSFSERGLTVHHDEKLNR
ncbi:RAD55 family ATPase [Halorussus sp. AFM4]|uniref:RAD55 family ATPase n=1 Tax=Halorussus sp. AFM4 TaxID=3421651 RepID=UPI003EB81ABC